MSNTASDMAKFYQMVLNQGELDGSRIVDAIMPDKLRPAWDAFCGLGPVALIAALVVLTVVAGDVLMWPVRATQETIEALIGSGQ